MGEVMGAMEKLLSYLFLSRQVVLVDAWLRPSSFHASHWNELPAVNHDPGYAHDPAHHVTFFWDAPDVFLGNKVSSSCRSEHESNRNDWSSTACLLKLLLVFLIHS